MTAVASRPVSYAALPPERPAAELEEELLARWSAEELFRQTVDARRGAPSWVFYEGPPTANGRPGIHHVFSRTIKDLFCRHRVMKGYHVTRKAGWDTHGLPVEIEVEKELAARVQAERGLTPSEMRRVGGKQLIEEWGIERFNRMCRDSVFRYRGDWERLSERIAYWLDYADPYITYSNEYIESVWWALATLHENDLLYRGHKILPYCPRCGTTLSSHEVAQGYLEVADPSVYVALELVAAGAGDPASLASADQAPEGEESTRRLLVWTTTPWTLVSNAALAVHPELEYVELRRRLGADRRTLILAEARAAAVLGQDYGDRWETVARWMGAQLVGLRYRRPLDWVPYGTGQREIVLGEAFVSAGDGSGVVHLAPAFGADDYAAGQRHGLDFLQPVDGRGEFDSSVPVVGGQFVKAADQLIVEELRRRGLLWKAGIETHKYPHCWRCGTPLLNYARTSWFIRTTRFRDHMLARNARVEWHPEEVGTGRFGEWLQNNIDWAVSRDRYWGTPLPVWLCDRDEDHVEAIGSFAVLAQRIGEPLGADFDPHKPFVDRHSWSCRAPGCGGRMRRVPEVIDTWFDSGSMPFAQWHFPFENQATFARHYPADFIAEGVDQTRGWFYSLLAIASGLGPALPGNGLAEATSASAVEAAPYRAVVVNDLVLDADGLKMSKSKGNVVDPWQVIARHGADAVRLFLVSSSQVWLPRRFDEDAIRERAGRFLVTLKNVYSGIFALYANFGWAPSAADPPASRRPAVDRWVLSRLAALEERVDTLLDRYDATAAANAIMDFVDEDLSKWYVRLNRHRFYEVDGDDNRGAFATLHEVLVVTSRLLAPFAPFVSDWIHRELTGESVHLAPFVRRAEDRAPAEPELVVAMESIRVLATLGRAAREEAGIKVRQPLGRLVCVVPDQRHSALEPLIHLLAAELNVKRVEFATSSDALVTLEAKPNFRTLGKKFGKGTPLAAAAVAAVSSGALRAFERGEPLVITLQGEPQRLDPEDMTIVRRATGEMVVKEEHGYFAALDATLTAELRREGVARELISRIQRMRKDAVLAVSDRIMVSLTGNQDVVEAVRSHRDWIASETLALEVVLGDLGQGPYNAMQTIDLDGLEVRIALTRIE